MNLFYFFALFLTASAAPVCQTKTVNLTAPTPFELPPTLLPPLSQCSYEFNVPSGFYAVLSFTATDMMAYEYVGLGDHFSDSYSFYGGSCNGSCPSVSAVTNWPSSFSVSASTLKGSRMRLQMSIFLKPLDLSKSAGTIRVGNNTASSVVYFKDWKQGTTYTITSNNESVYLNAAIPYYLPNNVGVPFSNVFILDGGKSVGTLQHAAQYGYNSNSNTLQLYLANAMNFPGAFLVTDNSNLEPCESYRVTYAPVVEGSAFVGMDGYKKESCASIIGEKDGSTPLTVTRLDDFNGGAIFTYMQGGPLSSHQNLVSPLNSSMLPKTIGGTLTTFYFSNGSGNIWYSVPRNQ